MFRRHFLEKRKIFPRLPGIVLLKADLESGKDGFQGGIPKSQIHFGKRKPFRVKGDSFRVPGLSVDDKGLFKSVSGFLRVLQGQIGIADIRQIPGDHRVFPIVPVQGKGFLERRKRLPEMAFPEIKHSLRVQGMGQDMFLPGRIREAGEYLLRFFQVFMSLVVFLKKNLRVTGKDVRLGGQQRILKDPCQESGSLIPEDRTGILTACGFDIPDPVHVPNAVRQVSEKLMGAKGLTDKMKGRVRMVFGNLLIRIG